MSDVMEKPSAEWTALPTNWQVRDRAMPGVVLARHRDSPGIGYVFEDGEEICICFGEATDFPHRAARIVEALRQMGEQS